MLEWLKWLIAGKELAQLQNIRSTISQYNRWFAEFDDIVLVLNNIECAKPDSNCMDVGNLRDKVREIRGKKKANILKLVWSENNEGYHHDFNITSPPTNNNGMIIIHTDDDYITSLIKHGD